MKQTICTIFLLTAISLSACRKNETQLDIKQYDDAQIQNYIKANGITGMVKAADTTGIYYKIILPGAGKQLDFPDKVSFVFSLKSLDGKYSSTDTINNHYDSYVGHVLNDNLPLGLQLAIPSIIKYRGASVRLLIPSHLAYGVNGYGSGSNLNVNTKILGNQSLDYYVHLMGNTITDNQSTYDDMVIQNYMKANNLTGYTPVVAQTDTNRINNTVIPNTYYYKILTPATSLNDPITDLSTINATYTGQLLNAVIFDASFNGTNPITVNIVDLPQEGLIEAFENFAAAGTKISVIVPSRLGFGEGAATGVPVNSCLRYTWIINSVTP